MGSRIAAFSKPLSSAADTRDHLQAGTCEYQARLVRLCGGDAEAAPFGRDTSAGHLAPDMYTSWPRNDDLAGRSHFIASEVMNRRSVSGPPSQHQPPMPAIRAPVIGVRLLRLSPTIPAATLRNLVVALISDLFAP